LAARFGVERFARRLDRFAAARNERRPAVRPVRDVLVARIVSALTEPLCHHRPVSHLLLFLAKYP
jgi:hypothetical protein